MRIAVISSMNVPKEIAEIIAALADKADPRESVKPSDAPWTSHAVSAETTEPETLQYKAQTMPHWRRSFRPRLPCSSRWSF